jgi:O-antigen/teichoic acid export membrane protein
LDTSTRTVPRRVYRGTALQAAGRTWGAVCTLGILFLTERALDPAGFGRFTFYLAVFAWLDALANLGTGAVTVQRTAGRPERVGPVLAAARRIRVGAGLLGVVLVGGVAFATEEPGALWILLASLYPVTHALELSITPLKNRIAWGLPVAIRSVASGLQLGFVALLALAAGEGAEPASGRPAAFLLAVALGSTLGNVLLHLAARRHLPEHSSHPSQRVTPLAGASTGEPAETVRSLLRASLPLGLSALCAQTYFHLDTLFVRAFEGEAALGPYNVAVRLMSWTNMLAQYVTLTALPWLTQRHLAGQLGPAVDSLGPPLLMLAGVAAGALAPHSEAVLGIFGPGFEAARPIVFVFIISR